MEIYWIKVLFFFTFIWNEHRSGKMITDRTGTWSTTLVLSHVLHHIWINRKKAARLRKNGGYPEQISNLQIFFVIYFIYLLLFYLHFWIFAARVSYQLTCNSTQYSISVSNMYSYCSYLSSTFLSRNARDPVTQSSVSCRGLISWIFWDIYQLSLTKQLCSLFSSVHLLRSIPCSHLFCIAVCWR